MDLDTLGVRKPKPYLLLKDHGPRTNTVEARIPGASAAFLSAGTAEKGTKTADHGPRGNILNAGSLYTEPEIKKYKKVIGAVTGVTV